MKKKIMSVLLSTAMVASMLAGCGSTTNEETSDATVAATKAAAQESTVAEEGGSETTGDGDLTSWILEDDTNMSGKGISRKESGELVLRQTALFL